MGQKVNPHGMRVGVIKDWDSRWFTSKQAFGDILVEDYKIRKTLKKQLYAAGVPKIEIERTVDSQTGAPRVKVNVFCAKPGIVIGKGGAESAKIEKQLAKLTGKAVNLNIIEVKGTTTNAQLVAEDVASQLERRIAFRRAMKQAIRNAMQPRDRSATPAKGIKVTCSGRLAGADIARTESYHEGTIPLQTLRADIDYGFAEAATTYGRIGIKVWIYKGEVLSQTLRSTPRTMDMTQRDDHNRGDRKKPNGPRGGQTGGYNRGGQTGSQGGGYNRGGQTGSQGGYNRPAGTQGGYNRPAGTQGSGQGGYNRPAGGQGGYNRPAGTQGGYNRPAGTQGGYNRTPNPADSTPKEGGNA